MSSRASSEMLLAAVLLGGTLARLEHFLSLLHGADDPEVRSAAAEIPLKRRANFAIGERRLVAVLLALDLLEHVLVRSVLEKHRRCHDHPAQADRKSVV